MRLNPYSIKTVAIEVGSLIHKFTIIGILCKDRSISVNIYIRRMFMNQDECLFGCIGYAYVPVQKLNKTYSPEEALNHGSLFPELAISINEYGRVCTQMGGVR